MSSEPVLRRAAVADQVARALGARIAADDLALPLRIEQVFDAGDLAILHLVGLDVQGLRATSSDAVAVLLVLVEPTAFEALAPVLVVQDVGTHQQRPQRVEGTSWDGVDEELGAGHEDDVPGIQAGVAFLEEARREVTTRRLKACLVHFDAGIGCLEIVHQLAVAGTWVGGCDQAALFSCGVDHRIPVGVLGCRARGLSQRAGGCRSGWRWCCGGRRRNARSRRRRGRRTGSRERGYAPQSGDAQQVPTRHATCVHSPPVRGMARHPNSTPTVDAGRLGAVGCHPHGTAEFGD
jgi:hypothetical protein